MSEPCGNTKAEMDNDKFMSQVDERLEEAKRAVIWRECYDRLIAGLKVYTFSGRFDLAERMANIYPVFNEFVDMDYDFIRMYRNGELEPDLRKLIEAEARVLASLIVG